MNEHEIHEQIEHAGHAGGGMLPQAIGITVAVLGVLMALCGAEVGAARTELIATMVEENAAKARSLTVAHKYRGLQAQLQQLHAMMPHPETQAKKDEQIRALEAAVKNPDTLQGMRAAQLQTEKVLNTVTPTEADVNRFLAFIERTREEADAAREWADSYHDAVAVYTSTARRFEVATLAAEIGIVIASVALLLVKKPGFARALWFAAIALGLLSAGVAGVTMLGNTSALHAAQEKIHTSEHHSASMNRDKEDVEDDKKLEEDIRKDIKKLTAGA